MFEAHSLTLWRNTMGCCLGRSGASDSVDVENMITIGKNRPLIHERMKWKADVPMTDGQLRSKRDEFWETAPAFEGRKEIWDALRAASALVEQGDYALAQAILDGANISLPDGTLRESYDELGNRYQVPYYCLSAPINLAEERSSDSSGVNGSDYDRSLPMGGGELQMLKLRLSTTGEDIKLECGSRETVSTIKQRLCHLCERVPPANQQRWFYSGRILTDKMRIGDCHIQPHFVIQVVVVQQQQQQQCQSPKGDPSQNSESIKAKADVEPTTASTKDSSSSASALSPQNHGRRRSIGTGKESRNSAGRLRAQNSHSDAISRNIHQEMRRCSGSLNGKRSSEIPTPVETS